MYGAKDGKADLSNLVATKELTVNLNGLTTPAEVQKGVADNTKDTVDVPATYLDKANFPGPFTAGVNQVIPYEFFARRRYVNPPYLESLRQGSMVRQWFS